MAALAVVAGLAALWAARVEHAPKPAIGLMTSLPVYWAEDDRLLAPPEDSSASHWLRRWMDTRFAVRLLDILSDTGTGTQLSSVDRLILAQPRLLQPSEFVALDDWVRRGGRVLIFADPVLTEESRYPIGDPRRPPVDALLSPILTRWGLEQRVSDQPFDVQVAQVLGGKVEIQMAGQFRLLTGGTAQCNLSETALLAECRIGRGRAVIFGDAALLSANGGNPANRAALERLTQAAFE